ncbi:MAG: hypothetical protein FJX59_20130, partial [Alphaproteobacteria bacterium]|nr:hypothetical protein [Alphaproteobacteria bacterium]
MAARYSLLFMWTALAVTPAPAQVSQDNPPEARRLGQVERDIKRGEAEREKLFQAQQATAR